jgi:hypothetical protein
VQMHNNKNSYEKQRKWSDDLIPQVIPLILNALRLSPDIWRIVETTPEQDMTEAADLILTNGETEYMIALRLREEKYMIEYPFDFTIRREYTQGYKTEYEKVLADRFADLMFYGFKVDGKIVRWVLLHMDAYRDEHWFDEERQLWLPQDHISFDIRENHDGRNNFIGYDINSFKNPKLVIAHNAGYYDDVITQYLPKSDGTKIPMYTLKRKRNEPLEFC